MGVTCQILINKPREGVHKPGQKVTGIVKYVVDEPTEYKDVKLSLQGKGQCYWNEHSVIRHYTGSNTFIGMEDYILHYIDLHEKVDEIITLHGEYQYPFEFILPENIPSSFKGSNKLNYISYIIKLKFVKPKMFSFNKVFTTEIPVRSYVNPTVEGPVVFGLDKKLVALSMVTPVINLTAEIAKTYLNPGENAQLTYKVNNDSDVKITSVKTELYCHITYTANCDRTKVSINKVKSCEVETTSIAERSTFEHACALPTLMNLYSIDNARVIKKEYRVKATMCLPMPYANATVEIPVLIGEQKDSVNMADETIDDQPPSYWEVMSEEKEKD